MTVTYIDSFKIVALSADIKPSEAPEGAELTELDTQKEYVFRDGIWKEKKSGTGIWSPVTAETLENKTLVLEDNVLKSNNVKGLIGVDNAGNLVFIGFGTAGLFAKVSPTGDSIVWADPATSGSWNPDATETLTNKTLVVQSNTVKQTTPDSGSILVDNGTKFVPLPPGNEDDVLTIVDGDPAWAVSQGGGDTINNYYGSSRPTLSNVKDGWYDGGNSDDFTVAYGMLQGQLNVSVATTETLVFSNTLGKYLRMPQTESSSNISIHTKDKILMREYESYIYCKFRTANQSCTFFIGMCSNQTQDWNSDGDFNSVDIFGFGRRDADTNFQIIHNAGSSNYSVVNLTGMPIDGGVHVVELRADPANNRFQYRVDDFGGTWLNVTGNIPRTNVPMGFAFGNDTNTSNDYNVDLFLLEIQNKLM